MEVCYNICCLSEQVLDLRKCHSGLMQESLRVIVWRCQCAAHDVEMEGCTVTQGRHRLLRQRAKAAGRQLVSRSTSSRGRAYELNEHQIPAGVVRKMLVRLEDQVQKTPNVKKTSSKQQVKFGKRFCKTKPSELEKLKAQSPHGRCKGLLLL